MRFLNFLTIPQSAIKKSAENLSFADKKLYRLLHSSIESDEISTNLTALKLLFFHLCISPPTPQHKSRALCGALGPSLLFFSISAVYCSKKISVL